MAKTKTYIPAPGRSVPHQDGTAWEVDKEGEPVPSALPSSSYYRRRVRDGDLVEATAKRETPAPAELAETEAKSETKPAGRARKES